MKLVVMGSGGVGGYFGARLAASGSDVTFVARGAHLEAMRRNGLRLDSELGAMHLDPVQVVADACEIAAADAVLFAVKQGQQRIKAARVLVVGAGGLGSPALMYLAAAGVGRLGVIDDDLVSLDNLQRQIVHDTPHVGAAKVTSAKETIARLNPHVDVVAYAERLTAKNALDIISDYDVVADGSDNFATRYLVSDACYLAKRTLVFAAIGPFDGYITTLKPYLEAAAGKPFPSYRCIFPTAPPPGTVANCAEVGVLGAVAGVLGALQATEVLKEIVGVGEGLAGRLLLFDARVARFTEIKVAWDESNPLSGTTPTIHDLSLHEAAAGDPACAA